MSAWAVVLAVAALAGLALLLGITAWIERWVLSPRALILSAARARRIQPDHLEALVTQQCDLLLGPVDLLVGPVEQPQDAPPAEPRSVAGRASSPSE